MKNVFKFFSAVALGILVSVAAPMARAGIFTSPSGSFLFPSTTVGVSKTIPVTITNDDLNGDERINAISVQGDSSFTINALNDTCSGKTIASPAGQCTFEVIFNPISCFAPQSGFGAVVHIDAVVVATAIPTPLDVPSQGNVTCTQNVIPGATPLPTPAACDIIQFSQPTYSFHEGDPKAQVWVTRTGCGQGEATVDYTVGSQTAILDTDFGVLAPQTNPGTLTFADQTFIPQSITFDISGPFDDTLQEFSEKFSVILSNPRIGGAIDPNIALGFIPTAEAEIIDNDVAGVIEFEKPIYRFVEGNLTAQVAVVRNGGSKGALDAIATLVQQDATPGTDFTPAGPTFPIHFDDGVTTPQILTFSITDDTQKEGDESFDLVLNPVDAASIGTNFSTEVHIIDNDDPGVIEFGQVEYFFDEGNPAAKVAVTRTGGSSGIVSATVTVNNGTTEGSADFTPQTDTIVTFAHGNTDTQFITFNILPDTLLEGDEFFILTLGSATGGASIGTIQSTDVHIVDDDVPGVVQFSSPKYFFNEGNLSAQVVVTRTGGSSGAVSATAVVIPQTATLADFVPPASLTVNFANGDSAPKTLTFQITSDTLQEGDEFFNLVLGNPVGGVSIGTQNSTEVHIVDDDVVGSIQFAEPIYHFVEGNLQADVLVTRTGGSSGAVSATAVVNPQTATLADFTPPGSLTVNFANGDSAPKTLTFQITPDTLQEGDEFFNLVLGSPTGGVSIGSQNNTEVHIIDDDVAGTLQFSEPTYSFVEGNLMAQVFVTRVGGSSGEVGATITVASGTAQSGVDFTPPVDPITVSFANSDTTPQSISFQINDDTLQEGDETFTVILSNPTNGASLGDPKVATVHIIDSDSAGTIRFSAPVYTFKETIGSAIVFVNREGGNSGEVTVHYATSNGTAVAPTDYTNVEGTLTWVDGDTLPKPIVIPVFPNSSDQERRFSMILDGVTGDGLLGEPHIADIVILDEGVNGTPGNGGTSGDGAVEGSATGGCSLGGGGSTPSSLPWMGLGLIALASLLLRKGSGLRAVKVSSLVVLALAGSVVLQGCGNDNSNPIRNQATAKDYVLTVQSLSKIVTGLSSSLDGVGDCADLNQANASIVADPVLACDNGFLHLIPKVNACSDAGALDGDWLLNVVPENCVFENDSARVDGDFDVDFQPVDGTLPHDAHLSTNGITVNDIRYVFHDLQISIDGNGILTCSGELTDQVTSCSIAADCSSCTNLTNL